MVYEQTSYDIRVSVEPSYLREMSHPEAGHYVWAYRVSIKNNGTENVRLESRYWEITDMNGHVQYVQGSGVVGEQPSIAPGEEFVYQSGAPLPTCSGMMGGHYVMFRDDGSSFKVIIPFFSLDIPEMRGSVH